MVLDFGFRIADLGANVRGGERVYVLGGGAIGGGDLPEGQTEGSPTQRVGDTNGKHHYLCCLKGNQKCFWMSDCGFQISNFGSRIADVGALCAFGVVAVMGISGLIFASTNALNRESRDGNQKYQ